MPLPVMPYRWRVFVHGLIAAAIGSMSNAVTTMLVDPDDFNVFAGGDWRKFGAMLAVSGLVGFFTYLKTHPLPDPEKDTDYRVEVAKQIVELKGTGDGSITLPPAA